MKVAKSENIPEPKVGILGRISRKLKELDQKLDNQLSFFVQNYGKTKFMVAMSKKAQVLGIERLWAKGPKFFVYFFLFYLIRDTILYIIIPIWLAGMTSNS